MGRALIALLAITGTSAADWPHWRGPTPHGRVDRTSGGADGRWLAEQPSWTAKVGSGASSPLVAGDHVYTLGRIEGHDVVWCLGIRDGKEVWIAKYRGPEYGRFHAGDESLYSGPSSTP